MATQPIEDFPEHIAPPELVSEVRRAGLYAGEAASMATRHAILGDSHKEAVWTAEQNAWESRMTPGRDVSLRDNVHLQSVGEQAFSQARGAVPTYGRRPSQT